MPEHLIRSTKLSAVGFTHGFFTRQGGNSKGEFASLNCSYDVGDDPACVTANLELVANHLDLKGTNLVTVSQVHGATVEDFEGQCSVLDLRSREADALVSSSSRFGLGVRTADCVPILIGCQQTGRAAAIHAGWKGIVLQVIGRTVKTLVRDPRSLVACIGPHIGQSAFEVSEQTARALESAAPNGSSSLHMEGGKPHVALGQLACLQLLAAGIPIANIEDLQLCTHLNEQTFFSYRRDGKVSGRQLSVIRPRQGAK